MRTAAAVDVLLCLVLIIADSFRFADDPFDGRSRRSRTAPKTLLPRVCWSVSGADVRMVAA
jgi:hypothetical protein